MARLCYDLASKVFFLSVGTNMKRQDIARSVVASMLVAAGAFALSGTSASAATLSFEPGTGVAVNFGDNKYDGVCENGITSCYNPSGAIASVLTEDLLTFDSSNPGPGLKLDTAARITVTFLGKEAGAQNYAFSLGGSVSNLDAIGSSYSVNVAEGTLEFAFKSALAGNPLAANNGTFVGSAAIGFSQLYNNGKTVYAFFDDSGAAGDRDFDDMVVRIDVAPVPVPAAGFLLVAGLGGLAALKRRKKA